MPLPVLAAVAMAEMQVDEFSLVVPTMLNGNKVMWQASGWKQGTPENCWWRDVDAPTNMVLDAMWITNPQGKFTLPAREGSSPEMSDGWEIDFPALTQTNLKTKTVRLLRRVVVLAQ